MLELAFLQYLALASAVTAVTLAAFVLARAKRGIASISFAAGNKGTGTRGRGRLNSLFGLLEQLPPASFPPFPAAPGSMRPAAHPFSPLKVIPRTKARWKSRKSRIMGIIPTAAAAIISW